GSAFAASLPLGYSTTANAPYTAVTTGSGAITPTNVPNSYYYGNSFDHDLANTVYTPASGNYAGVNFEFYDDYVFTIRGATVNSVSSTISLGNILSIENLQARLYSLDNNTPLPVLDEQPNGGVINSWSLAYNGINGSNTLISVIDNVQLSAGTYVLELRGTVSGSAGGSYSGVMNVSAIPVPSSLWLMASGVVSLCSIGRKRRAG
ncbi:MAG TPA: hypothetical protein VFM32_06545, partial [Spongiibacteraceae bacterium]|nr:hypothetical protein [Spongiibacteraceae bacterium]